ncbi:MAG: SGNH/GDSL hydrolase family protein [Planctomycetales bacterium]|nr:SGNH/GDSL hydrolase family protein [Planctomycetales bacterium]
MHDSSDDKATGEVNSAAKASGRRAGRRRASWRVRLLLLFFGLALGLIVAEIGLRLAGVAIRVPYVPNDYVGTVLQPHWSGWQNREGRALLRINSLGFRDEEHAREKPRDTVRILVLGDSYVEAAQVDLADTFWKQLERRLNEQRAFGDRRCEVIAMGVSGWGTAQQLLALRHYGLSFSPEYVLVAFLPANDVRNNSAALEPEAIRPFFEFDADGELRFDESYLNSPQAIHARSTSTAIKVKLLSASRVLQVAQLAKARLLSRDSHSAPKPAEETSDEETPADETRAEETSREPLLEPGLDEAVFREPTDRRWREAWRLTEELLVAIDRESAAAGAKCYVLTLTAAVQVDPDASVQRELADRLGVDDLDYAPRRIQQLAEDRQLAVIDLVAPLRTVAAKEQTPLHGFANTQLNTGHWNEAGHAAAAKVIADRLAADWKVGN